ncbi:unnamed protein product [Ixodes persulcatus]
MSGTPLSPPKTASRRLTHHPLWCLGRVSIRCVIIAPKKSGPSIFARRRPKSVAPSPKAILAAPHQPAVDVATACSAPGRPPTFLRPSARIATSDSATLRLFWRHLLPLFDRFQYMGRIGR